MGYVPDFPLDKLKAEFKPVTTENYDRVVSELAMPLDSAQIVALNELCAQIGIKVPTNPTKADFANAKACVAAQIDCESCRSRDRITCYKYIAKNINDKIVVDKRICSNNFILTLIKNSAIPEIYSGITFNNYNVDGSNKLAVTAAKSCITDSTGIYICGRAGVGKTTLACCIVTARAKLGKPSLFRSVIQILNDINPMVNADKFAANDMFYRYKICPCLVIDDLGQENINSWSVSAIFELIDTRYRENLMTIITSNIWDDKLADIYGEGTARRINEMCTTARIIG